MLVELIDKYYQDKRDERNQEHFYVTDVGKCPRAVYFSMKHYPREKTDPRALRIFDRGDITHQRLMSTLFGIPEIRVVASEIDIPSKALFHGRADAIISFNNKLYIVEFKSSSEFKFRKLEGPENAHRKQLQLYMHYFKIPQGVFIYENKNTQDLKEFEERYDPDLCKRVISDFEILKKYIEDEIIPPKPKDLEPWQCDYCEFRKVCQKIEEENK
ncbi:PD-(D/E)XK nuclease family protein [bacterium]|nr:PD-(D/E)XK nuclease family protein [bacterium]